MDTIIVAVYVDGRKAYWDDNGFHGDTELVKDAINAAWHGLTVDVLGLFPVDADRDTPLGALAALSAHLPGRTLCVLAPRDVTTWLDEAFAGMGEPDVV